MLTRTMSFCRIVCSVGTLGPTTAYGFQATLRCAGEDSFIKRSPRWSERILLRQLISDNHLARVN